MAILPVMALVGCFPIEPLSSINSSGPPAWAEVEVPEKGEVIFEDGGLLIKVDAKEIMETPTHYEFDNGMVSTNNGASWELLGRRALLDKKEYTIRGKR